MHRALQFLALALRKVGGSCCRRAQRLLWVGNQDCAVSDHSVSQRLCQVPVFVAVGLGHCLELLNFFCEALAGKCCFQRRRQLVLRKV